MPPLRDLHAVATDFRMFLVYLTLFLQTGSVEAVNHGHNLHFYLFENKNYDSRIRPADDAAGKLTVKLGLRLTQLLRVDEKNQIMTTSVWIRQEWTDPRLTWEPKDYGNIKMLHIPSSDLWRPDIVLYNNADGDFAITMFTKATVYSNGKIVWQPPAIYKSYCPINVEFFPFDIQECFMKFGVWTYDGTRVDLQHVCKSKGIKVHDVQVIRKGIDLREFYPNVEWDIVNVTARRKEKFYTCCPEPYPDIMFNVTIRRRTLFYTINLIIPCIAISCLTVLVFYLPADSGEKITLSLSILMALAVFFLLLNDIIPPTSLVMPMIGKYLLFTMVVVVMSIFLTVVTLSINFRSPSTHTMSPWVRRVFTEILPTILLMRRPDVVKSNNIRTADGARGDGTVDSVFQWTGQSCNGPRLDGDEEGGTYTRLQRRPSTSNYPPEIIEAVEGVKFIADHMREEDISLSEDRDWKYVSMVIDRLFLYIFTTAALTGSLGIFLHAPSLYDHRPPLNATNSSDVSCQY